MFPKLLALSLISAAALSAAFAARAEIIPLPTQSDYVIEVLPVDGATHEPKCMTVDPSQPDHGVRVQRWNRGGLCGIGDLAANVARNRTVWTVAKVAHTDGRAAYTFRNRANGKCLIRGRNGKDVQPTIYLWGPANAYCGFPSADALIDNGQGAWQFDREPVAGGLLVTNVRTTRNGPAYLSFATMAGHLQADAAMLHVDRVFRFTRVPESCSTSFPLLPNLIRVCGVGDFAQPMRVEGAGNLGLPFDSWNATAGMGMGDLGKHYVAVLGKDAQTYCSRLRTGSHEDWRVPTGAELLALYNAFPDNALQTRFGWSTGMRGHQSTDRNGSMMLTVRFHNGGVYWQREDAPFPVACVR